MAISASKMTEKQRLTGLIGGTFDPVHFGHLRVAVELAEAFGLPQVALLPCHQSPHRDRPCADPCDRKAMLELALEGQQRLTVDDRELQRGGYSYTVETLQSLRAELGPQSAIYFAMGFDAFNVLERWKNWQDLFELANIVVVHRPDYVLQMNQPQIRERLSQFDGRHYAAGRLYELAVTPLNISASKIRQLVTQRRSISFLLPGTVEHYIYQHRLYQHL